VIAPGQSTDMFWEIYGDYELTFDWIRKRATGREGTVRIFVLDAGNLGRIDIVAPIVGSGWPTTYSGGSGWSPWSC
jgi:hypothetical protein